MPGTYLTAVHAQLDLCSFEFQHAHVAGEFGDEYGLQPVAHTVRQLTATGFEQGKIQLFGRDRSFPLVALMQARADLPAPLQRLHELLTRSSQPQCHRLAAQFEIGGVVIDAVELERAGTAGR